MAEHKFEITRGAIQLLEQMLLQPEWAKDTAVLYRAGAMLERLDNDFGQDKAPKPPKAWEDKDPTPEELERYNKQVDEWANQPAEFEVSEKEREACKTCLTEAVNKGQVRPTKHYMALARTLGLVED